MTSMASGKQSLLVVVWEWENKQRRWRPYPPEVTQQLERAYSKNLRHVFLGDSDPSLANYAIHLPQMEQESISTGDRVKVRRSFFPQSSPAGQGAVWQWEGDEPGDWHTYDMWVQCLIEETWGTGAQTLDMSKTIPACPYIINFCNLNQTNSKTGFVRAIRRVQQAAYPVGRPPPSFYASQTSSTQVGNCQTQYCIKGQTSLPTTSCSEEKQRRRSTKDNPEFSAAENKSLPIISKVLCLSNKNSSNSSPGTSDLSNCGRHLSQWITKGGPGSSPPKPLPRSSVPPSPMPRTFTSTTRQPHSQQSASHTHTSPRNSGSQMVQEDHNCTSQLPHSSRIELSSGKFGSNHTLDSDCSSLVSGRRPSVDTISTYLSQDDDPNRSIHCPGNMEAGNVCTPVVKLINVESDENMDEDVFAEDQEVCDVMRGVVGHSPPLRATSPLTQSVSHHHHNTSDNSRSQISPLQQCHFMPINAAQSGLNLGLHVNGVKRKRTRERAVPGMSHLSAEGSARGGDISPWDPHVHNSSRHHFTGKNPRCQHGSRAPIAAEDKLLLQYTSVVESPSEDMCSICMWGLTETSGYLEEASLRMAQKTDVQSDGVISLNLCKHQFHLACVREMAKSSPQFLECPNCKTLHGEKFGNQPPGNMSVTTLWSSLPGHPDCSTVQITYNINNGIQGPEHPHPGRPYQAVGFPRIAYIPNNDKGKKVVRLLREAWRRRLIFTVGPSVTTGLDDCVTWNEIHHKTEWNNFRGHGYPDPGYLSNILKELALHGITESSLE